MSRTNNNRVRIQKTINNIKYTIEGTRVYDHQRGWVVNNPRIKSGGVRIEAPRSIEYIISHIKSEELC